MSTPLLSVVVPTYGRPKLLPVAVRSALECSPERLEVIVVPNGPDDSWKQSLASLLDDSRVRVEPIAKANANTARNHGLMLCKGKYVRFLDDDDFFLPAAIRQVEKLEESGAEICSSAIIKIDEAGNTLSHMIQRDEHDLVCAMVRPERICLPTAHVFLREALANMKWNESLNWEQDTDWMMRLCAEREWRWLATSETVGCWTHHTGARVSEGVTKLERARSDNELLLRTAASLASRGALDAARADAFSEALWALAHANFHKAPFFCTGAARAAMRLNPKRRPPDTFYHTGVGSRINPLLIEYLLVPMRILKNHFAPNKKD